MAPRGGQVPVGLGAYRFAPQRPREMTTVSTLLAFSKTPMNQAAGSGHNNFANSQLKMPALSSMPQTDCPTIEPVSFPDIQPAPHRPILLAGDDLAWLAGRRELAGRKVILADPNADALALLAAEPLDAVVASYADVTESIALLQTAAATIPGTLGMLRANTKELGANKTSFPVIPRMDATPLG